MPDLIWTKWFPQDWLSDPCLSRCSPAARGIWKDIIDAILLSKLPELVGTTAELSRITRCSESEFLAAITELKRHDVGHFNGTKGQHKIACRRIRREFNIRELRRKAGKASGTHRQHTPQHTVGTNTPTNTPTPSASASASICSSLKEGESKEGDFEKFWEAYPRKVGKKAAERSWVNAKDKPGLAIVIAAVQQQSQTDQWRKEGGRFIPHPATWINQGRWSDSTKVDFAERKPTVTQKPKTYDDAVNDAIAYLWSDRSNQNAYEACKESIQRQYGEKVLAAALEVVEARIKGC